MPYEKMTMLSRKCPWCDKEFVPVYNAHIFCSRECEHKYWKHPPYETEPRNQMFKSLGSAESHEKWTNKIWSGS